ncbi:YdcF family protein [Devosia pacifica]|uniref:YdcF family protein n=1 Tax=Devosia pacifica TaxID=1335967 RepID=UPI001AED19F3|nr:YdcF family protein [Devosia pacifica]
MRLLHWLESALALVVWLAALCSLVIAADVARFGNVEMETDAQADAAMVLGAAVLWDRPSPVFEERLRHAVTLYEQGRVQTIVITGGLSPEDELTEAEAGRRWVMAQGVPDADILIEPQSRTTLENFLFARTILAENDIATVLVVSDPFHMRRAMAIANRAGISAVPAPTPTSRFVSLETQLPFLARETWFMTQHLLGFD